MEISELQITKTIKNLRVGGGETASKILEDHGWTLLGSGAEGAVAEHPGKAYVLKLYEYNSNYTYFVNLVKHFPNIHFPKFSRYVRPVPGTKWKYVRMEKLSPIEENTLIENYMPEMVALQNICYIHGLKCDYQDNIVAFYLRNLNIRNPVLGARTRDQNKIHDIYQRLGRKPDNAWIAAVTECCNSANSLNLQMLDLHYGNFMLRGNCLIIADPYWK
jgi:hypothetical protein